MLTISQPRQIVLITVIVALFASIGVWATPAHGAETPTQTSGPVMQNVCTTTGNVPDAGFKDVSVTNVHSVNINCAAYHKITLGISPDLFNPEGTVTRWQMALFLTRTLVLSGAEMADGSDQGFVDIGNVSIEAQTAINQLHQVGITSGTGRGTFDPEGIVTRGQMALFLLRTLAETGTTMPVVADQGFVDIGDTSIETQIAINRLYQARITLGVSPGIYDPTAILLRQEAVTFLIRVLDRAGIAPAKV